MPTTFVHALLPASCLGVSHRALPRLSTKEWVKLAGTAFILGNAPDLDLLPAIFRPDLWHTVHRYMGHNVFSLFAFVFFGQWALRRFVSPKFGRKQAWVLSLALVASHVALDAMSQGDPAPAAGVPIFWPFTRWELLFPWHVFPGVNPKKTLHPLMGLAVAPEYWHRVVFVEIAYSIFFLILWSALWGILRLLYLKRAPKTAAESGPELIVPEAVEWGKGGAGSPRNCPPSVPETVTATETSCPSRRS